MPRRGADSARRQRCYGAGALLLCGWLLVPAAASAAEPADLEALMALLGRVQRVEVAYEETVESGLVSTAIGSRGRLEYQAPDRLRRISDRNDGFDLDGQRIRLIRGGTVVTEIEISDIAPLEAMVGALRGCFAGDLAMLEDDYRLHYAPREESWELRLEPLDGAVSRLLKRIELHGSGATVRSIAVLEADGDRRTMRLRLLAREPADLD